MPPRQLIPEQAIQKGRFQLLNLIVGEVVALWPLLRALIALADLGVQVRFLASLFVLVHARKALDLAAQQVNFLEVPASLGVLVDEGAQARFKRSLHALNRLGLCPLFGLGPFVQRSAWHAQVIGNVGDAPAHPVQRPRVPARAGALVHQIVQQLPTCNVGAGSLALGRKREWARGCTGSGRLGSHRPWSVGRPPRARTPLALCKAQPQGKAIAAAQGPGNHTHLPANRNVWAI